MLRRVKAKWLLVIAGPTLLLLAGSVLAVIFLIVIVVRREGLLGQSEVPLDRLFSRRRDAPDQSR